MELELKPRNGITLTAIFGSVTVARNHLSTKYLDLHHEELDKISKEADAIRRTAMEMSRAEWADIDLANAVARLTVGIEEAEDIDDFRASEVFKDTVKEVLPLAECIGRSGASYRLVKLQRDESHHGRRQRLWKIACAIEICGDMEAYFSGDDDEQPSWPRLSGDQPAKHAVLYERVGLLERLDYVDSDKLTKMLEKRAKGIEALTEEEEGN